MTEPAYTLRAEDKYEALERFRRAIMDRCTCKERDPNQLVLEGHEPECSLQASGWLG
jgi:hypothetical protein